MSQTYTTCWALGCNRSVPVAPGDPPGVRICGDCATKPGGVDMKAPYRPDPSGPEFQTEYERRLGYAPGQRAR